jgi:hypothetical protein
MASATIGLASGISRRNFKGLLARVKKDHEGDAALGIHLQIALLTARFTTGKC